MNISHPLGNEVKTASFSCYTSEEIKKLSVKEIVNPILFDAVGIPNEGGLYDPALGPFTHNTFCGTCNLDFYRCPGHFGHIELPVPVYNPLFFVHSLALLRSICLECHYFKLNSSLTIRYTAKLKLLKYGLLLESQRVDGIGINDFLSNDGSGDHDNESDNLDESDSVAVNEHVSALDQFVKMSLNEGDRKKYKLTAIIAERKKIMSEFLSTCSKIKQCGHCGSLAASFKKEGDSKIFRKQLSVKYQNVKSRRKPLNSQTEERDFEQEQQDTNSEVNNNITFSKIGNEFITPEALHDHFHKLFVNESELCTMLYCAQGILSDVISSRHKSQKAVGANIFFIDVVAVPPTRFRPANVVSDKTMENPQNEHLARILNSRQEFLNYAAKTSKSKIPEGQTAEEHQEIVNSLMKSWINLQDAVNGLVDNTKGNIPTAYGKQAAAGIKQILEKKEGLFRKHLMGKRVNYAARSVISPDPYVDTDEIGVPLRFAKKLTYPEPVTEYNLKEMTNAVINGPDIWPGATHVQHEDGTLVNLASLPLESRIALSEQLIKENTFKSPFTQYNIKSLYVNKKVFRHLRNGDMLLLNRQPTLHKPSIMAHKARILKGEMTIRMHYANCNAYNADFDGDEMNMHFPQNEIARAEAMIIGNTNQQYIGPTSGNPLRGLIQDHVVTGIWMTCKDTFFIKGDYQQIVFAALRPDPRDARRVLTVPPAIHKPKPLWTGKQVITTILMNLTRGRVPLNLKSKNKVSAKYWGWSASEEDTVIFMDGEHLTGVLDQSQVGAKAFGLVHSCYELYSADIAGQFLSILGRLFTAYVKKCGFSCRMDDLHLTHEGDKERRLLMENNADIGKRTAFEYVGMSHVVDKSELPSVNKDFKNMMEEVLRDTEKHKGLDAVMKSKVNGLTSSIIATCIPRALLKVFPYNNMQTMTISGAKGSSVNVSQISCCLGQQELEGRRVPVMVSGKSLPSFRPYDPSAYAGGFIGGRFLTGIKPQEYFFHCMAGREGLIDTAVKTSRSGYLQRCLIKHLEGLRVHYDHTVRDIDGSVIQFHYGEDSLDIIKQTHLNKFQFNAENYKALIQKYDIVKTPSLFNISKASLHAKKAAKKPEKYDPVLSVYSPSKYLGSVSETFHSALEKYAKENPDKLLDKSLKENSLTGPAFIKLMHLKYLHSLVEPGEAVGLLAAQGIGEPSTQMTLNTFHFAGFGAKNVTLGIPRLREIIMTASADIKTPMMTLPLRSHVTGEEAEKFCQEISKLNLAEVIEKMTVYEQITQKQINSESRTIRKKMYTIRMEFYPKHEYKEEFNIIPRNIEDAIELNFIGYLESSVKKESKSAINNNDTIEVDLGKPLKKSKELRSETFDEGAPIRNVGGSESDDGDDDATNDKVRLRTRQHATYDAPDEDDLEVIRQTQRESLNEDFEMALEDENNEQHSRSDEVNEEDTNTYSHLRESINGLRDRRDRIITNSNYVTDYRFDHENGSWCEIELQFPPSTKLLMLGMAEAASKKSVIREVNGISKCYPITNETDNDNSKTVVTEGVNFYSIWKYDNIIDLNNIYSNDIVAILNTYGVEAARAAIIKEISVVFAVYGININPKHLTLVADYMTFEGKFKPFNRVGLDTSTSPLLKMSFESTCSFLTQATLHGDTDLLDSPSARLVLGKVVQGGTGSFEVRVPFVSVPKCLKLEKAKDIEIKNKLDLDF